LFDEGLQILHIASPPQSSGDTLILADTITTDVQFIGYDYPVVIVAGTIVIAPGGSLLIGGSSSSYIVVKFAPDAKIIIERGNGTLRGGFLEIKCAHLTGWGDCSWEGIDIHGYDTSLQNTSYLYQGVCKYSQSIIENARSAFYMGNRDAPADSQHLWTGGIVQGDYNLGIYYTYFNNNTMSFTFPAPYPHPSASYISRSVFISDKNLNDPCYTRPLWFIKVDSTNGLKTDLNTFGIFNDSTHVDYNIQDSTYGIQLIGSRSTTITNSYFENVNKGIDVSFAGYSALSPNNVYIYGNTIYNSQTAIRIADGYADTVRNNFIAFPPRYAYSGDNNGIITDSTQQIYIRDNIVDSLRYGITVNNCDSVYNSRIWNNTVSNCKNGINTGGKCGDTLITGLTVYCNQLNNNGTGWNAYDDINNFRIPPQGKCVDTAAVDFPPGNSFSGNTSYDISNSSLAYTIIYYLDQHDYSLVNNFYPQTAGLIFIDDCPTVGMPTGTMYCDTLEPEKYAQQIKDSSNKTTPYLGNIYPNPFSYFTNVPYFLPLNCQDAEIDIFDILGNKIDVYPLSITGINSILKVSSEDYSGGVYFCILKVENRIEGWKKMVIIK
jgi:hypothetical protein